MARIKIKIHTEITGDVMAELHDELSPTTFKKVLNALPIESTAHRWGNEIYFTIPVSVSEENSKELVDKGAIAFWPPGNALCIFWGATPASQRPNEIRPASPVNVVGRVVDDPILFSNVKSGTKIRVEKT